MLYKIIKTGIIGAEENDDILISESAFNQLKIIKDTNNLPNNSFIRIGVKGSVCEGLNFFLAFDNTLTPFDNTYQIENENIVIDIKSVFYLLGIKLEYDNLENNSFKFITPFNLRAMDCEIK